MECRGLILNRDTYEVVARSFDRFFNYGEGTSNYLKSINDAIVFDKIDGSLITCYHHNGKWNVATRSMAFAEGENGFGRSYRSVFDKAFDINKLTDDMTDYTFVFELVSPETRVVTPYSDYKVYLLTIRDKRTGLELDYGNVLHASKLLGVDMPNTYNLNSFEEVIENASKLPALEEGYVCKWADGFRLKIKNPSYLAIAHLRENGVLSESRVIKLVMENDHEEYLSYFGEDRPLFQPYIDAHKVMLDKINEVWYKYKDIESQKDFALAVNEHGYMSSVLFKKRKMMDKSISDIISDMSENMQERLLKCFVRR
jgi:T4 RnlA family RNA ligase